MRQAWTALLISETWTALLVSETKARKSSGPCIFKVKVLSKSESA